MKRLDFLRLSALRTPLKVALVFGDRQLLYRELDAEADRCAQAIAGSGHAKGSRIGLLASNCVEYVVAHYGIARAGCIAVHISVKVTNDDLTFMLNKAGVSTLLAHRQQLPLISRLGGSVPSLKTVVVIGEGSTPVGDDIGISTVAYERFVEGRSPTPPDIDVDEDAPGALNFTGGTTGFPKGVLTTHRARTATIHTALTHFGIDGNDIVCVATPLFHAAGLFVVLAPAIALGTTVVLLPHWEPPLFMASAQKFSVTATFLVPSQLNERLRPSP